MSNHQVTNHLVQDLKSNGIEVDPKGLKSLASTPFLLGAASALRSIEKESPEVQTGGQDTDNEAIGYGALVKAKLELYKIQEEYGELQKMLSTITKGMFNLTKSLAKGVSDATRLSMDSEADQMRTQAYGEFASAAGQIAIFGGFQLYSHVTAGREMSSLTAENESLEKMGTVYESKITESEEGLATTHADANRGKTEEEIKQIKKRIEERKIGQFDRDEQGKLVYNEEAEQEAAAMVTDEDRATIREKIRKQIETNENKKNTASQRKVTASNNMQVFSQASSQLASGVPKWIIADQKAAQADYEANKVAIQAAQNMVNPAEASKLMDEYQKDAIGTLETIKSIERANKFEPSR